MQISDLPNPESLKMQEKGDPGIPDVSVEDKSLDFSIERKLTKDNDPRNYGRCFVFFYYKGDPLCVIGPDCKLKD